MEGEESAVTTSSPSKTSQKDVRRRRSKYSTSKPIDKSFDRSSISTKDSLESLHRSEACEDLIDRLLTSSKSPRKRARSKYSDSSKYDKLQSIEQALKAEPVDITTLKQLAITHGGLISDEMRCKVWPHLLHVSIYETSPRPIMADVEMYRDYMQVVLDVNRCLRRFPPDIDENIRLALQNQLVFLIVRILMKHPELHYYQGFHDICITFLLAVGEEMAFALMDQLSMIHLRDFMEATMDKTVHMLNYLYPILGRESIKVRNHMEDAGVGTIFCLSWLITWFGHVLNDYRHIVRLYDFFLANEPLMPIYLAASIVLHRESDILEAECDMPTLHSLLSKVPDDLPFEELISKTGDLYLRYPPEVFKEEVDRITELGFIRLHEPKNSLKTTRNGTVCRPTSLRYRDGSSSSLFLLLTPSWLRQQRTFVQVVVCTAVATGATFLYSYLANGEFMSFLPTR